MARIAEPTKKQENGWKKWVKSRPDNVRVVAEMFEPWSLYRIKKTGQRVTIYSFSAEKNGNVIMTVNVTGDFNLTPFNIQVFGVSPDDLEPCDLPAEGEPLGAMLTDDKEIEAYVNAIRPAVLAAREN